VASPALLGQISKQYIAQVEAYIQKHQIPVVPFEKGQRKDTIAQKMRRRRPVRDAVVFVGIAQEKAHGFKATKDLTTRPANCASTTPPACLRQTLLLLPRRPRLRRSLRQGLHLRPLAIKVCLNGHEWAKRQLEHAHIAYKL